MIRRLVLLLVLSLYPIAPSLAGDPGPDDTPHYSQEVYDLAEAVAGEDPDQLPTDDYIAEHPFPVFAADKPLDTAAPEPPTDAEIRAYTLENLLPAGAPEALQEAVDTFWETSVALPAALPTEIVLPYGYHNNAILALPGRFTDLRLEPGERVSFFDFATPTFFQATAPLEEATDTRHILFRPTRYGLETNLVVVTDRRTYNVEIRVPEKDRAAKNSSFHATVSFYYPDHWKQLAIEELTRKRAQQAAQPAVVATGALSLDDLAFSYTFHPPAKKKNVLHWRPSIFDDGQRTYLVLPPQTAVLHDLPNISELDPSTGHLSPLNVHRDGDRLVIHGLFSSARLTVGRRWVDVRRNR